MRRMGRSAAGQWVGSEKEGRKEGRKERKKEGNVFFGTLGGRDVEVGGEINRWEDVIIDGDRALQWCDFDDRDTFCSTYLSGE